jgi:lysophospholipase L1-like esterase
MFPKQSMNRAMFAALISLSAGWASTAETPSTKLSVRPPEFKLQTNDVVVFLGGANVVAAQETGHLETLLTVKFHGLGMRFHTLAWEGDTVYAQPRDLNFPQLKTQLQRVAATVAFLHFGQTESLQGRDALTGFVTAYEKLLDELSVLVPRLVLVTPPPFEKNDPPLPDVSARNQDLALYAEAIRELAHRRGCRLVNLYGEFSKTNKRGRKLTDNGIHFTAQGQAEVAGTTARLLGFGDIVDRAGTANAKGEWPAASFESVRRVVIQKNRLWFDYWRPMNWAFLAGDRTEQPSSRDHRDPKIRWFPAEMEKFVPLIEAKEKEIEEAAKQVGEGE